MATTLIQITHTSLTRENTQVADKRCRHESVTNQQLQPACQLKTS
jgi:hypothetical protein